MSVARTSLAAFLFVVLPLAAAAEGECRAVVNRTEVLIAADVLEDVPPARWRETILSLPRSTWDWARGAPPPCDSATILSFMTALEGLPPEQAQGYCLASDTEDGWLLVPGERNFRGRCTRTLCERVNLAADDTVSVLAKLSGLSSEEVTTGTQTGGTVLATGSALVMDRIYEGLMEGAASAVVASPVAATAAAVTVLGAGGAVWLCQD